MKNNLAAWGVALAVYLPLLAAAQAAKTESPTAAPQLTYRSAFADYKPYKDAPLADWREVNDKVAGAPGVAMSGHAGHSMGGMKGMEMPTAPAAPTSGPMKMPIKPMAMPMPMHDDHAETAGKP